MVRITLQRSIVAVLLALGLLQWYSSLYSAPNMSRVEFFHQSTLQPTSECAVFLELHKPWRHFDSNSWFHGNKSPQATQIPSFKSSLYCSLRILRATHAARHGGRPEGPDNV